MAEQLSVLSRDAATGQICKSMTGRVPLSKVMIGSSVKASPTLVPNWCALNELRD